MLAGCTGSSSQSAPPAQEATATQATTTVVPTTTAAPITTVPVASLVEWANPAVQSGAEDFNALYRSLDAIRSHASETLDLALFDTASRTITGRDRLEDNIADRRFLDGAGVGYVIDDVQVLLQPDDGTVILAVTDTRTGDFVYLDQDTGGIVETKPGRTQPTIAWLVTMERDIDSVWFITGDTILFNDDAAQVGTGDPVLIDSGAVGDSAVSAYWFGDDYCVIHHQPAAVVCITGDQHTTMTTIPDSVQVDFRLWDIDNTTLFFAVTSNEAQPVINGDLVPNVAIDSGTPGVEFVITAGPDVDPDAIFDLRREGIDVEAGPVRPIP